MVENIFSMDSLNCGKYLEIYVFEGRRRRPQNDSAPYNSGSKIAKRKCL
jgi:hypothetical protein